MNSSATAVSLREKFGQFTEHWSPKKIAGLNDYEIKIVKIKGEFVWHSHTDTDEMFPVPKGQIRLQLRDGDVSLGPGELFVVPRRVETSPNAAEDAPVLLIAPMAAVKDGISAHERRVESKVV